MNESAGTKNSKFGFPGETFREIITKAVCGKAQKSIKLNEYIKTPDSVVPNQILGCSVTELLLNEPEVKDADNNVITVVAGGVFKINIWYAYNNGKETDVLKYPVKFAESLALNDYDCQTAGSLDVRVTVDKSPVVVSSEITEDHRIKLDVEMDLSTEVIGETKMLVQVYVPGCNDDEEEED
ncbi:outer spore coat protein CotE [Desulfoscipio gibsoniae]|uniref:Outer spore coat protein E (CotE) n=1 Tax=Desulfoscipio gibsoniae DSM 7213 TaxID=767817 RepID=R4KQ98_9FIRM|nr:outer spore coat protein CotE [Desulfoscipio gibsoniae]AGL02755.1 Outer spore coat protein E (CotE) [Desulfoscipio gibsoniae DSM 7213]